MSTGIRFYGGAAYTDASAPANIVLKRLSKRVQTINCTSADVTVQLFDAEGAPMGGPIFFIMNVGSTAFDIVDFKGGSVRTLDPGETAEILLYNNETQNGSWYAHVESTNVAKDVNHGFRSTIKDEPAVCWWGEYQLVRCDDPKKIAFVSDTAMAEALGKVVLIDGICYKVYAARNTEEHGFDVDTPLSIYETCQECYDDGGSNTGPGGDGDDSNIDPSDQELVEKWTVVGGGIVIPVPSGPPVFGTSGIS